MKKIYFFAILLFVSSNSFSQGFNSVSASNPDNVIAVGNQGKIFRSFSGGSGWSSFVFNSAVDYKSVTTSGNYYFIAGSSGKVYKTGTGPVNP
ncbi:MAG: hypothetical protein MUE56_06945, partial [Ignavibacteria bacterium]|nr:hypothetical protein [Ignavibacteria bacterium]